MLAVAINIKYGSIIGARIRTHSRDSGGSFGIHIVNIHSRLTIKKRKRSIEAVQLRAVVVQKKFCDIFFRRSPNNWHALV